MKHVPEGTQLPESLLSAASELNLVSRHHILSWYCKDAQAGPVSSGRALYAGRKHCSDDEQQPEQFHWCEPVHR